MNNYDIARRPFKNVVLEDQVHQFSAEASELALSPGRWPTMIEANDGVFGNGLPLLRHEVRANYAVYRQQFGCVELTIWNT